jgi:pimeloyl-ACP methyl ester carboxylesterase
MTDALPILLVPGLACTPVLYHAQIAPLWRFGPVTVADHSRDDSIAAIGARILANAPPRFALGGLSMGGYVALEIMRQAPERVVKLMLMDTGSRADTPEATERRKAQIALAQSGRYREVFDLLWPIIVHKPHQADAKLRAAFDQMMSDATAEAFVRQQQALITRPDSRPGLGNIACPSLVLVGADDALTPPALSEEMAQLIPGAKLVKIPDCGHLSTMEQPERVTRELVAFLGG